MEKLNLRKGWLDWVKKVRQKESRKQKKIISRRVAMDIASKSWPDEKARQERKFKRAQKKKAKESKINKTVKTQNVSNEK